MVSVRPTAADSTEARQLLAEYFGMRAATFPGAYTPVFPAPESFDPPAGVFLIVADEGELAGCGGIRRIPDGPRGIRYEVKHLFLRPATRGRGWGRLLLDELERMLANGERATSSSTPTTPSRPRRVCTPARASFPSRRTTTTRTRRAGTRSRSARTRPAGPPGVRYAARTADGRGRCARRGSTAVPASAR